MKRKSSILKLVPVAVLAVALGCGGAYRRAAEADTAAAWRAFLIGGEGDEAERAQARARLDDLSFAEARREDTLAAYKRYLGTFPEGRHRAEAGSRIEALRFERAVAAEGPWELQDFLARHPRGAHVAEARRLLVERSRVAALDAATPAAYEAFLRRYPQAAGVGEVERALADTAFEDARSAGTLAAYEGYLARFPAGPHRLEAELGARTLRVQAAVLSGDAAAAQELIRSTGADEVRAGLTEVYTAARLDRALSRLDRETLAELAAGEGDVAARARAVLAGLAGRGSEAERLAAAAQRLATSEPGLPPAVLEVLIEHPDARRRWVAARALGYVRDGRRLPALVRALADRNVLVRQEAALALRRLGGSLQPVMRDVAFTRILVDLSERSATADRRMVEGLLLDAAGRRSAARHTLGLAAAERGQVLARLRLAELETDAARRAVLLTGAALYLRDALQTRIEPLAAAAEAERVDGSLLRQGRAYERLLADALARVEGLGAAPARFPWLDGAQAILTEGRTRLEDAEARARVMDPAWLAWDVDEAEETRSEQAAVRLADVETLAKARALPGVDRALLAATLSPHADVAEAARRALAKETP